MAITDTWLKAQSGREQPRTVTRADRDGLAARISPKGKITWQIRYRRQGRQERMDLGSYPLTSLKRARELAGQVREQLEDGIDPKVARELEKQRQQGVPTVESLVRDWYKRYCSLHKKGAPLILRSFEIHVFPDLGWLPADQVCTDRWMHHLEALSKLYPAIAERILINIKQAYKWGHRLGKVPANPLGHIGAQTDLRVKKRFSKRVLSDQELRLVWEALEKSRITAKNRLFVKLCLFYGCRSGELRLSNIEHWDLEEGVWTIPPENHKTGEKSGKPILRPIVEPARSWVQEAIQMSASKKKGPLFNNNDSHERMSRSSVLHPPYNLVKWVKRHRGVVMDDWSMHDLRRTMRTKIADLAPPHVAEIMLGHVLPGQWRVYDHYDYLAEQKEAYEAWWERLSGIVGIGE